MQSTSHWIKEWMTNRLWPLQDLFLAKSWKHLGQKLSFFKEELTAFQAIDLDASIFLLKGMAQLQNT